jgi:hydroxyacylglutathione hydrolase
MLIRLAEYENRLEDIYLIQGVGLTSNIYVIGKKEITLIDAGNGARINSLTSHLQKLKLAIEDVVKVIFTHAHADHIGGLEDVCQKAHPEILIHEAEAHSLQGRIPEQSIITLRGGERVATEKGVVDVIHTPGHSRGALCLYDRQRRTLFSGDTVFPGGFFGRCDLEGGDKKALVASLNALTKLNVDILLPGHEEPVFQNADKHIKRSYDTASNFFTSPFHHI